MKIANGLWCLREFLSTKERAAVDHKQRTSRGMRQAAALDAYLEDDGDDIPSAGLSPSVKTAVGSQPPARSATERTQIILDVAEEIIRGSNKPIKTTEVLEELRRRNIDVHGANPRNTLSAIISYSERFTAHGRSGWTIRMDDDAPENTEAADNPNLGGRMSTASDEHRPTSGGTRAEPVKPVPGGGT